MEKVIKLVMKKDKNLSIQINNEEKYLILCSKKSITAEKIYEILDYKKDDHYNVISECESNTDEKVLELFKELFVSIINKVNEITTDYNEEPDF